MPTTVTKKIGNTNSPTTMDYNTLQGWENDAPTDLTLSRSNTTQAGSTSSTIVLDASASGTNNFYNGHAVWCDARSSEKRLITAYNGTTKVATIDKLNGSNATWDNTPGTEAYTIDSVIWRGECYDQGVFPASGSGTKLTISGETTDASNYVILACATGASFSTKSGVRTTALYYSSTTGNGVAIEESYAYGNVITNSVNYTRFDGLQIKHTGASGVCFGGAGTNATITNCIIWSSGASNARPFPGTGANYKILDCLIMASGTGTACNFSGGSCEIHGSTVIGNASGTGVSQDPYSGTRYLIKNCAVFNFTTATGTNPLAGCGYNATDSASIAGSNNQTSLTFASQFQSSTNDFRAISTGSLDTNGTPDSTNIPNDISGTARSASTPTIGCWEVVAAASSRIFRTSSLSGLSGVGQKCFNPPLTGV